VVIRRERPADPTYCPRFDFEPALDHGIAPRLGVAVTIREPETARTRLWLRSPAGPQSPEAE
jgi:hypothetical protein